MAQDRPDKQTTTRRIGGTLGIFLVVWAVAVMPRLQGMSGEEQTWTFILYGLCCTPTLLFLGGHHARIPFMPFWGMGYFLTFSPTTLTREQFATVIGVFPIEVIVASLSLTTIGGFVCLIMFYSPLGKFAEITIPRNRSSWGERRVPQIGLTFLIVGIVAQYVIATTNIATAWAQIALLTSHVGTAGALCLFLLQLRRQLSSQLRWLLWGVFVPVRLLLALQSGVVYQVIDVLIPFLLLYSAERRRVPWQAIVILGMFLIPVAGVKHEYRQSAWYGQQTEVAASGSVFRKGLAFIELVVKRLAEGGTETVTSQSEVTQSRASQLETLAVVIDTTPTVIPFWDGETYADLLWTPFPRFLFPNKPLKLLGQTFGHRYGFLDEDDLSTTMNLPHQVVEMYSNFGVLGVIVGMALVGCLYRALMALVADPNAGERELIMGCTLFSLLVSTIELDFSMVFGGVVQFIVFMAFALRSLGPAAPGRPAPAWPSRAQTLLR